MAEHWCVRVMKNKDKAMFFVSHAPEGEQRRAYVNQDNNVIFVYPSLEEAQEFINFAQGRV